MPTPDQYGEYTGGLVGGGKKGFSLPYTTDPTNWYKALPYGFAFTKRGVKDSDPVYGGLDDSKPVIMYLPILPENIHVMTHFATNVITTLYGVVEEHSEIRYYDIEISGTTGMAPKWVHKDEAFAPKSGGFSFEIPSFDPDGKSSGRSSFKADGLLAKLGDLSGGFLPEVTNTLNQVKDLALEVIGANDTRPFTGLEPKQTGYWAFHNFYKFLLRYKSDASGEDPGSGDRQKHPLQFLNYKDGQMYDAAIQSFTLTRSTESPMLYRYNIKMRCYNLRSLNNLKQDEKDERLSALGLSGIEGASWFAQLTRKARAANKLLSLVTG